MADKPDQNELAAERTHAAWLRTALTFIVATVAMKHYATTSVVFETMVLVGGGVYSAAQAIRFASSTAAIVISTSLIVMLGGLPFVNF